MREHAGYRDFEDSTRQKFGRVENDLFKHSVDYSKVNYSSQVWVNYGGSNGSGTNCLQPCSRDRMQKNNNARGADRRIHMHCFKELHGGII